MPHTGVTRIRPRGGNLRIACSGVEMSILRLPAQCFAPYCRPRKAEHTIGRTAATRVEVAMPQASDAPSAPRSGLRPALSGRRGGFALAGVLTLVALLVR